MDVISLWEIFCQRLYDMPPDLQRQLVGAEIQVIDFGGNVGYFALWVDINLPNATLVAFEADPGNALRYQESLNLLGRNEWRLLHGFAGPSDGLVMFAVGEQAQGSKTLDGSGEEVPAIDVFPHLAKATIVKMDIEGGEWDILADPRFNFENLRALVLEYHRHLAPDPDTLGSMTDLLVSKGYRIIPINHDTESGFGMLWAIRD